MPNNNDGWEEVGPAPTEDGWEEVPPVNPLMSLLTNPLSSLASDVAKKVAPSAPTIVTNPVSALSVPAGEQMTMQNRTGATNPVMQLGSMIGAKYPEQVLNALKTVPVLNALAQTESRGAVALKGMLEGGAPTMVGRNPQSIVEAVKSLGLPGTINPQEALKTAVEPERQEIGTVLREKGVPDTTASILGLAGAALVDPTVALSGQIALDQKAAKLALHPDYKPTPTTAFNVTPIEERTPEMYEAEINNLQNKVQTIRTASPEEQVVKKAVPTLNIGLNVGGELKLTPEVITKTLKDKFGINVKDYKVVQSGTEPTMVPELDRAMTKDEVFKLSELLQQDAIAHHTGKEGILAGPKAADWGGEFNPEYYLTKEGQSFASLTPKKGTLSPVEQLEKWQQEIDLIHQTVPAGTPEYSAKIAFANKGIERAKQQLLAELTESANPEQVLKGAGESVRSTAQKELLNRADDLKVEAALRTAQNLYGNAEYVNRPADASLISSFWEQQGKWGKTLSRLFDEARSKAVPIASRFLETFTGNSDINALLRNLDTNQRQLIFGIVEGKINPLMVADKRVRSLATLTKALFDEARVESIKRGLPVLEDYGAHMTVPTAKLLKDPVLRDEIIGYQVRIGRFKDMAEGERVLQAKHAMERGFLVNDKLEISEEIKPYLEWLVKEGQAKNEVEALKKVNQYGQLLKAKEYGHIEKARTINDPFYSINLQEVIPEYVTKSAQRYAHIDVFGKDDRVADFLFKEMGRDMAANNISPDKLEYAKEMYNLATGKKNIDFAPEIMQKIMNVQSATKLSWAFIMNSTQPANTAAVIGINNYLKGMAKLAVDYFHGDLPKVVKDSGAILEQSIDAFYNLGGSDWTKKIASALLYPLKVGERWNRASTATAMPYFLKEQADILIAGAGKTPEAKEAGRLLEKYLLSPSKILRDNGVDVNDLQKAVIKLVSNTQFFNEVVDNPRWANSKWGRMINQFKSFSERQHRFVREELLNEVKNGNWAPLIRYASLAPVLGASVRTGKAALRDQIVGAMGGHGTSLDKQTKKSLQQQLVEGLLDLSPYGMLFDIYRNLDRNATGIGAGVAEGFVPVVSSAANLATSAYRYVMPLWNRKPDDETAKYLNEKQLLKTAARELIPFVGGQVADILTSDEERKGKIKEQIKEAIKNKDPLETLKEVARQQGFNATKMIREARKSVRSEKTELRTSTRKFRKLTPEEQMSKLLGY